MSVQLLFCACPDYACAERIAETLVERRLAACVNLIAGVSSIYRWQGRIECASEVLLLIKSRRACYDGIEAAIRELHPYELPELIAVEAAAGLPPYLAWVGEATTAPD
jgi:periplasmic divalent cation tolerance protein